MAFDRQRYVVAAGDHAVIALVLGWGYVDHHTDGVAGLLDVAGLAEAVAPFLAGFLVVALLFGTYARERVLDRAWSVRTVAGTWFGGAGLGLVIRTSPAVEGAATWPFGLVVTGFGLLALVAWRLAIGALLRRRSAAVDGESVANDPLGHE